MGVYPFMFGAMQDFEPIVQRLIREGQKEPYDWDAYARAFQPKAEELLQRAGLAQKQGNSDEASELYLSVLISCPSPVANTNGGQACISRLSYLPVPLPSLATPT